MKTITKSRSPMQIVKRGYNQMGDQYHHARNIHKIDRELMKFVSQTAENGLILDAGCGAGVPGAKFLMEHNRQIYGIDLSETMLNLAKKNVPQGKFYQMDMRKLKFDSNTFDGIMSLFAIFHVPRKYHKDVFREFFRVLKPSGKLMINNGIQASEGVSRFFGVPMFWSNYSPVKTLNIAKSLGFEIDFEGSLIRGGEQQYWIFATKP